MLRTLYQDPDRYVSTYWERFGPTTYFVGDSARRDADAARDVRREAGELACRIYTVHGSETDVMVSVDWVSLERAREFLASPKLMEGMDRAGVREMPKSWASWRSSSLISVRLR